MGLAVVGVDGGVVVVLWVNESVHSLSGVVFLHEIFADEEAVVANGAQAVQSSVRADATFGDSEETVGNAADEVEASIPKSCATTIIASISSSVRIDAMSITASAP